MSCHLNQKNYRGTDQQMFKNMFTNEEERESKIRVKGLSELEEDKEGNFVYMIDESFDSFQSGEIQFSKKQENYFSNGQ